MIKVSPVGESETHKALAEILIRDVEEYIMRKHPGELPGDPRYKRIGGLKTTDASALKCEAHFDWCRVVDKYWKEYNQQRQQYVPYNGHTYKMWFEPEGLGAVAVYRVTGEDMADVLNDLNQNPIKKFFKGWLG